MRTTSRRLETLALLQAHPGITAPRLAARLGVTERTARRDVAQLREIGYRIDAEPGRAGGYRLAGGAAMPPLLLDADEVAAVAVGLRTAVAVTGLETAAVTALAKLTQVVPARWAPRLTALADVRALPGQPHRRTGRDVLVSAALACRADEAIRIRHTAGPDDLDWAARWLAYLNLDIDVLEPAALAGQLRALGRWLLDRH